MTAPSPTYDYVTFQLFDPAKVLDTKAKGTTSPRSLTCPICSAKYTRPTHLHKHIRSHTYKCMHQCVRCEIQFARRDVLKRHLNTCKGVLNQHSRKRRACEACVLSRTKCDRQPEQPCSRCVARGGECVFISQPPRRHPEGEIIDAAKGSPSLPAECTPPSPASSSTSTNIISEGETPHSPLTPLDSWVVDRASQAGSPQIERGQTQLGSERPFDVLYPVEDCLDPHDSSSDGLDVSWLNPSRNGAPPYNFSQGHPSPLMDILASTSEDQDYIRHFFSDFCKHFPLVHPATWSADYKPSILIRAMQACGALFVKTKQAATFIKETLSSRNLLIPEFAGKPEIDRNFIILAVVLLQTVGLFHQDAEQQVTTSVYHHMLVMMIRQTGLVTRLRSWMVPDLNDTLTLEQSWRKWAIQETMKRALVLSYFHDCCYPVYFSRSAAFESTEFDVNLPCDDDLWDAPNSIEWLELTRRPSCFSTDSTRLSGVNLQQALVTLAGESEPLHPHHGYVFTPPPPNPFSHFILIHAILKDIYSFPTSCHPRLQSILYNWLQTWMHCCDVVGPVYNKSSLIYNALQFYWLAQISLYAIENSGSGWLEVSARSGCRFTFVREWLERIRLSLQHNHEIPARLWGEQMIITSSQVFQVVEFDDTVGSEAEQPNGLFSSFFDVH
ncbi:hypothetical protein ARMSODRAFT_1021852 [Armillaria solidipes]|uniref:Zn(2)-C6 fungal-type domain-containing protein n=1 Tax=Armillaria solidipes TaxID=1076256 RepID=A0A2H3BAA6_9AGAR|nr:hypothetical protein ARMSODRAFT_1021852 [Armillaria solidipes]